MSTGRVGELWRQEDHEALMTTLQGVDVVAVGLVALAQREKSSEASKAQKSGSSIARRNGGTFWA